MSWRDDLDTVSAQWIDLSAAHNVRESEAVRAIIQIARGEQPPSNFAENEPLLDVLYRLTWWMYVRAPALDPRYVVLTRMNLDLVLDNERTLSQLFQELDELETRQASADQPAVELPEDQQWLAPLSKLAHPAYQISQAEHPTLKTAIDQALALFIQHGDQLRDLSQKITEDLLSGFDSQVRAGMLELPDLLTEDGAEDAEATTEQKVEKLLERATAAYNTADVESAERLYSQLLELDPDHIEARAQRGICRAALENLETARLDFDYILSKLDPDHLTSLLNRGLLHHSAGRYPEALEDYTRALQQVPENVELLLNQAAALSHLGQLDQALETFNKAAQIEPDNALTYKQRAHLHRKRGEPQKALKDYDRSIELNPRDSEVYAARGFLRFMMEHIALAIEDFSQAISLAPGDPTHYYNRGNAHSALAQYEEAIQDYTHAIALDSEDSESLINRGSAYMLAGNIVGAAEDWTQAIELDPYHPTAYLKRATLWMATEQNDEAISDLSLALKYAPKDWPFTADVEKLIEDLTLSLNEESSDESEDAD